jgi:hypothetical protein
LAQRYCAPLQLASAMSLRNDLDHSKTLKTQRSKQPLHLEKKLFRKFGQAHASMVWCLVKLGHLYISGVATPVDIMFVAGLSATC